MVNLFPISMMVFDEQVMCSSTTRLEKASIINLIFDVYDDVNHVYDDGTLMKIQPPTSLKRKMISCIFLLFYPFIHKTMPVSLEVKKWMSSP
ncbi:unnamed protein product [Brassica napus]|uniref:(rape) hypothetical protein n=1 Tax=Brassica napus TaxID=3708 RepID=A0A816K552_BRANA|nr:unnamed protein product [Brassica napus]